MNNKTLNKFRFRSTTVKKEDFSTPKSRLQIEKPDQQQIRRKGFSSQYLHIIKKFQLKVLPNKSNRSSQKNQTIKSNLRSTRLKTDLQYIKNRYEQSSLVGNLQSIRNVKKTKNNFFKSRITKSFNKDLYSQLQFQTAEGQQIRSGKRAVTFQQINHCEQTLQIIFNLSNHAIKVRKIKSQFQEQQINVKQCIKLIKIYILRQPQGSVSKLDSIFIEQKHKKAIKKLLCLERIILVGLIDSIYHKKIRFIHDNAIVAFNKILNIWLHFVKMVYEDHISEFQINFPSVLKENIRKLEKDIVLKNSIDIESTNKAILVYELNNLFKFNSQLLEKFENTIDMSETCTINRTFYETLKIYASYTNQQMKITQNIDIISFFMTCPSPYILKTTQKNYTLVLDLDETLIHSKVVGQQYKTQNRPGLQNFLLQLSQHYEIIIFTSSVQSYAEQVTKKFPKIDHLLFRQHTVRMSSGMIKDISRIGRNLSKMIIIDDIDNNFKLQKQNGIKIKAWKGDKNDNQLEKIKQFLLNVVQKQPQDIRKLVPEYKKIQGKNNKSEKKEITKEIKKEPLKIQPIKQQKQQQTK